MLVRPYTVRDVRDYFVGAKNHDYAMTTDKTGVKCLELIGASFLADEAAIFGEPNLEYIKKEVDWYESESLNINDIYGPDRPPPEAWTYAADPDGFINSNYGHLIYSSDYHNQYDRVLDELTMAPDGRRAMMIYNRPQIWDEYDENGKSDFICTNAVAYYIRNGRLDCCVQMRSNDVVFGYKNDYAWQQYVLRNLAENLNLEPGKMIWQVQNLHVYERHFDLVKPKTYMTDYSPAQ
jgi:thymidylate synthase